jgi:hypothetical protein
VAPAVGERAGDPDAGGAGAAAAEQRGGAEAPKRARRVVWAGLSVLLALSPVGAWLVRPDPPPPPFRDPIAMVRVAAAGQPDLLVAVAEATQGSYRDLVGADPNRDAEPTAGPLCEQAGVGDERPVTCVTASEAMAYANLLTARANSQNPGAPSLVAACRQSPALVEPVAGATGYRLPTGEEWRAAADSMGSHPFAGGEDPAQVAWTAENAGGSLHPVGERPGEVVLPLQHMSGNASEWTETVRAAERLVLGGSFFTAAEHARVDADLWAPEGFRSALVGFRVVRAASPAEAP